MRKRFEVVPSNSVCGFLVLGPDVHAFDELMSIEQSSPLIAPSSAIRSVSPQPIVTALEAASIRGLHARPRIVAGPLRSRLPRPIGLNAPKACRTENRVILSRPRPNTNEQTTSFVQPIIRILGRRMYFFFGNAVFFDVLLDFAPVVTVIAQRIKNLGERQMGKSIGNLFGRNSLTPQLNDGPHGRPGIGLALPRGYRVTRTDRLPMCRKNLFSFAVAGWVSIQRNASNAIASSVTT